MKDELLLTKSRQPYHSIMPDHAPVLEVHHHWQPKTAPKTVVGLVAPLLPLPLLRLQHPIPCIPHLQRQT